MENSHDIRSAPPDFKIRVREALRSRVRTFILGRHPAGCERTDLDMIITVTLNPCIHHILAYEEPEDGKAVVKPIRSFWQPGGKGLNTARVIASMGGEVLALTTSGDLEGELLLREVRYSGVEVRYVNVGRPTRISTCCYNMSTGAFRELLEGGAELDDGEVDALFNLYLDCLPNAGIVALNGSSPCPNTDDFFRKAAKRARKEGCFVVVDTYGKALVNAVEAAPNMLKMNLEEVKFSFGLEPQGEKEIFSFSEDLLEKGIEHVLVTDGPRGGWLISRNEAYRILTPEVREIHAIGSGDAMLGALLARRDKGDKLEEACRWGAAAGAVNAGRLEVCKFKNELVEDLLPSIRLDVRKKPPP